MNPIESIRQKIELMRKHKDFLQHEIDLRYKEIDEVKSDTFGIGAKIKQLAMRQVMRSSDQLDSIIGEGIHAYAQGKDVDNAQDYIDIVKHSIDDLRGAISKTDDVIRNLEHHESTLAGQLKEIEAWLDRADEMIK